MLVHVIDASNPRFPDQIDVVEKQLRELDLDTIPCLRVLNKIDLIAEESATLLCKEYRAVSLSALDVKTFGPFIDAAQKTISRNSSQRTSVKQTSVNQVH